MPTDRKLLVLLIVLLVLVAVFTLPAWPYAIGWGYGPSGLAVLVALVVVAVVAINGAK